MKLEIGSRVKILKDYNIVEPTQFLVIDTIHKGTEGKVVDFIFKRVQMPQGNFKDHIAIRVLFGCSMAHFSNSDNSGYGFHDIEVL